jgi:hypothetical protein
MIPPREYRAGQSVEDYCRQCHEDRMHTVIVVDVHAQPLRVTCDFCRSEHNYRGGPRNSPRATEGSRNAPRATESSESSDFKPPQSARAMTQTPTDNPSTSLRASDLDFLIRRIIRDET